jgi:hypothetical protein
VNDPSDPAVIEMVSEAMRWTAGARTTGDGPGPEAHHGLPHVASMGNGLAHVHRHIDSTPRDLLDTLDDAQPPASPTRSTLVYSDATSFTIGVFWPGPPPRYLYRQYLDHRPIAFAELAAALVVLIHTAKQNHLPTTITIATDSSVVYYVLSTGKGKTLRMYHILQQLYITWFTIKSKRGHRLVVRWVTSDANLADPVSRGVLAS